jgi:predicted nucleic acid-binding protein
LILYFDTSALIKLYADELDALRARDAAASSEFVATSIVAYTEMRSAFARKPRSGEITADQLDRFKLKLESDWNTFEIISIDESIVRLAGDFAEKYSLRGFDAVHLASADALRDIFGSITFACFDADLSPAASACGMTASRRCR